MEIRKGDKRKQVGLRVSGPMLMHIEKEALERRWTRSQVVRVALEERYGLAPELPAPAEQPPATEART